MAEAAGRASASGGSAGEAARSCCGDPRHQACGGGAWGEVEELEEQEAPREGDECDCSDVRAPAPAPRAVRELVSAAWLRQAGAEADEEPAVEPFGPHCGLMSDLYRVSWRRRGERDGRVLKLVCTDLRRQAGLRFGLAREGCFLGGALLRGCATLQALCPRVDYARGDLATGDKAVLMEDLEARGAIEAGALFGCVPLQNWTRSAAELERAQARAAAWWRELGSTGSAPEDREDHDAFCAGPDHARGQLGPERDQRVARWQASLLAAHAAARLHASFSLAAPANEQLLLRGEARTYLRGATWACAAEPHPEWQDAQARCRSNWDAALRRDDLASMWDARLVRVVRAALDAASPAAAAHQPRDERTQLLTLVHGDLHASNVLLLPPNREGQRPSCKFLDWEMVGVGSGAAELAHWTLSHLAPAERRAIEEPLLREYHRVFALALQAAHGLPALAWSECWREYRVGGAARWIYLLSTMLPSLPRPLADFFHGQLAAFLEDHADVIESEARAPAP
jgi:hypothetical protein